MKELNNEKMLEMINKVVLIQYAEILKDIKSEEIKLFMPFPYTGAANISEPVKITIFKNLEKLLSPKYNLCKN